MCYAMKEWYVQRDMKQTLERSGGFETCVCRCESIPGTCIDAAAGFALPRVVVIAQSTAGRVTRPIVVCMMGHRSRLSRPSWMRGG
jgi:hypothetical protein